MMFMAWSTQKLIFHANDTFQPIIAGFEIQQVEKSLYLTKKHTIQMISTGFWCRARFEFMNSLQTF